MDFVVALRLSLLRNKCESTNQKSLFLLVHVVPHLLDESIAFFWNNGVLVAANK